MELDQFVEYLSGKSLTEQQKQMLDKLKVMMDNRKQRVVVIGERFNPALAIGNLIHEDFNKLEDRVMTHILKGRDSLEGMGKTGFLGTTFSEVWFDEFEQMQRRDIPYEDVIIVGHPSQLSPTKLGRYFDHIHPGDRQTPADHPTRKREPKGPRGKWGKLK